MNKELEEFELVKKYQQLNLSFKRKFVYHFGIGSGFYSEFNNMVLCMLFCLKNKIQFQLYSQDAFFFEGMGWSKMFLPFCPEKKNRFHHYFNRRDERNYNMPISWQNGGKEKTKLALLAGYKILTGCNLTSDLFYRCRTTWFEKEKFTIPELGIEDASLRRAAREIIRIVYRFNSHYSSLIMDQVTSLSLPEQFIGIHIRGGDKILERDLFSYEIYINKASQLSKIKNAFILTDDYQLYKNVTIAYPEWNFFTLTFPDEIGYDNSKFEKNTPERRERELLKVFASLEIMRNSELFIGTYSSNPGMFLGMCMPEEKVYGVDFMNWIIL